ncbi:MAG: M20 family metallopeptidase [Candidatus Omnitrophica bacterium]|nr:M20 family metallopeptidase [Candidatus Omnitrophota bacterium]
MDKVFNYISRRREEAIQLVRSLVSIRTVNPPGENYEKIINLLDKKCRQAGLATKRMPVPGAKGRVCLLADWNIGAKKTLHINGHYDVVPCAGGWHSQPFKPFLSDGKIYGRGTEDMKGGIACYIMAVSALKKYKILPKCNLQFSFTPDEETGGSTGFGYLVKKGLIKADYGIGEGYSGAYVSCGNKGVIWLNVEIKGRPAHGSSPYKGVNSFEGMVAASNELIKLNEKISKRKTSYMTQDEKDRLATMVLGGAAWGPEKVNIVPACAGFSIDRRFLPEENINNVKKEIFESINKVKRKIKGLKINIKILNEQDSAVSKTNPAFFGCFRKGIKEVLNKDAKFAIMAGATDMRFLMAKGTPCLGYAPQGEGRWHADDEYVSVKSLIDTTKVFAYMFENFGE